MNQQQLNKYFSETWKSNIGQYKYSGWNLVELIRPYEYVIDVGCGFNEFKLHISNLIGIDPANEKADVVTSIEEYQTDQLFDVAFCLGSINFGNEETILYQIECVVRLLKPKCRIFWRCNPGRHDHGNDQCNDISFYKWTIAKHLEFSEKFGFSLNEAVWDNGNRIYAEWVRLA